MDVFKKYLYLVLMYLAHYSVKNKANGTESELEEEEEMSLLEM